MTDTIKPTAYRIDWPSEPELGHSLEDDPCSPELGRCEALYSGPDVAALVRQALDALTYQGTMGPTRRQRRHAAIKALEAFLAQQEGKP